MNDNVVDEPELGNGSNVSKADSTKKVDQIVLLFEKPSRNNNFRLKDGATISNGGFHEISYVDDQLIRRQLPIRYAPQNDTITIQTKRGVVEVQHAYRGMDKLSYLFHAGDTVLFTYTGLAPFAKILNRKPPPLDVNYDLTKRQRICRGDFPAMLKKGYFIGFYNFNLKAFKANSVADEIIRVFKAAEADAQKEADAETLFLDSLKRNNLLSPETFAFYQTKRAFDLQWALLYGSNLFLIKQSLDPALASSIEASVQANQHDSLLVYSFYHDWLRLVTLTAEKRVQRIVTSNSNVPDYRQVQRLIGSNPSLSQKTKAVLMLRNMESVIRQSSVEERQQYLGEFAKTVKDTALVNFLTATYRLDQKAGKELALKNSANHNLTFEHLLEQKKGRVVYVDFWASWCAPCIRSLPASHQLRQAYEKKGVTFVYLSKDEVYGQWEKAARKHDLLSYFDSYIITNQFTSRLLEDLNVSSIPRYLIYDKSGNLVHENAPGPGGTEIAGLLDKYLAE